MFKLMSDVGLGVGLQLIDVFKPFCFIVYLNLDFVPKGIRTPVAAVKGQCPRPLDDGDLTTSKYYTEIFNKKII